MTKPITQFAGAALASPVVRYDSLEDLFALGDLEAPVVVNHRNLSKSDLEKIALLRGRGVQTTRAFGQVREIRVLPGNLDSIAESCGRHDMHTDGTFMPDPPREFALYFVRTDPAGGGVSWFLDAAKIMEALEPKLVFALNEGEARFARRDRKGFVDAWTGPLLSHDPAGRWRLRWRYDEQVRPEPVRDPSGDLTAAIEAVLELCESLPRLTYAAEAGDLVLVPNSRWLHGRSELSQKSERLVYRAWIG